MLNNGTRIEQITEKLAWLTLHVELSNGQGRTDINHDAENFYCGLLNLVLGTSLRNMNELKQNFPSIDLGDPDYRLAIQVTSNYSRKKIEDTLQKFFENKLDSDYSRLVMLIIGKRQRNKKPFKTERFFRFSPEEDVWDTQMLCEKINALSDEKKDDIIRYLDEQMKHPWEKSKQPETEPEIQPVSGEKKLKNYLPDTLGVDGFKGREMELDLLAKAFDRHENPIFITGLGGIGKTELAIRFCQARQDDYTVHFVRFAGTFEDTVTQGVALGVENLWLSESRPKEQIYHEVMRVLEDCDSKTILIIDNADPADGNFDSLKDETYRKLCRMNLRLIITTRAIVPGGVKVKRMRNDDLREIIGRYAEISKEDADALIDAVDGHTLTVDLMGRAMQPGWKRVTPAMLLDALRKNALSETIGKTVKTDYNRDQQQEIRQQKIHEHLRTVFNVVDIPENAKQAMCCATLLPEAGMDADLFASALPESAQAALDALANRAWLRVNNANMVTIHPVVRLICFEELKPTDEICRVFLENLWGGYDKKKFDYDLYSTMAELYTTAAEKLENERGGWSGRARALWYRVGQCEQALTCAKMTIERREESLPADDPDLADAYNDMGIAYMELHDYQGMTKYFGKALEIRQRILDADHVDLAKSYNNVGAAYHEKGDYQIALEYKLQAMRILEKILPADNQDIATSYNHVGVAYRALGNYFEAKKYHEKELAIRKKILSDDHPEIASSYACIGNIHGKLGDYSKALECHKKELAISKKSLPADHVDLAKSYNNVGVAYGELGDYSKARGYIEKAVEIEEKALSIDPLQLAGSYNNLGVAYHKSGDNQMAVEYLEKALAIRAKIEDHPDVAETCHWMGRVHGKLKNYPLAVKSLEKALAIYVVRLPAGHPNIKNTRDWLDYYRQKLENQHPSWMNQVNRAQKAEQEER